MKIRTSEESEIPELTPEQLFAQAIIVRAANDYRRGMSLLKKHPELMQMYKEMEDEGIEFLYNKKLPSYKAYVIRDMLESVEFFKSDLFEMLTNASGVYILRKLREEAAK